MQTIDLSRLRDVVALHDDARTLKEASTDFGGIVRKAPRAVAAAKSAGDVQAVVAEANRAGFPVSTRGAGHSPGGQSLSDGGVVLDMTGLDRIGEMEDDTITVQAGVRWRDVLAHVRARGRVPMVLTSGLDTTVGGTLAAGGLGLSSPYHGAQADNVAELDVVTGAGDRARCSPTENATLFDSARCGLGQCSVIVEARLRLRRPLPRMRSVWLLYDDLEPLLADQASLLSRTRAEHIAACCVPPGGVFPGIAWRVLATWLPPGALGAADLPPPSDRERYWMCLSVESEDGLDGDDLPGGLNCTRLLYAGAEPTMDYYTRLSRPPSFWLNVAQWNMASPWMDGFVPWSNAAAWISEILKRLPADLLRTSMLPMLPVRGRLLGAPLLMRPDDEVVAGLGVLPMLPPAQLPETLPIMKEVDRLFMETGGKRYLAGWVDFDHEQWKAHYGPRWSRLREWKAALDPAGILNPGFIRYRPQEG